MPVLAINLPEALFAQIKALVEDGKYQSPDAFLEVAAFSQLALERGASPEALLPQKSESSLQAMRVRDRPSPKKQPKVIRLPKQVFVLEEPAKELSIGAVLAPFALQLEQAHPEPSPLQVCRDHVFGQVNRIFPLKLACRWILGRALSGKGRPQWPAHSEVLDSLGDAAAQLGSLLENWDGVSNRKRDDQWATGLPRRGNSASKDRFLSQFIARVTRSGDLSPGAIYQYQLANFADGRIALTSAGIGFAGLPNPILDQVRDPVGATLGRDEITFLCEQIQRWSPGEHGDMTIVLNVLMGDKSAPQDVLAESKKHFPSDWSEAVVITHVSGLIARLTELQFIKRWWHGRNVEYRLGDLDRIKRFLQPA